MSFQDIFKSSFLTKAVESFSVIDVVLTMGLATLVGLFIYAIYKKSYQGILYSRGFNISLIALSVITAMLIMAVTSNVVLSLGMVGALSIVRFRAAIKDPTDIVYLFWSIGSGIVIGAGLYLIGIVSSLLIGAILYFFSNKLVSTSPYLLIVRYQGDEADAELTELIKQRFKKFTLKSKAVKLDGSVEVSIELRLNEGDTEVLKQIAKVDDIVDATLVSYNGEFTA